MFYDILERQNNFLDYKNKKFKKSKNCHFFNGATPWFGPKWPFFQVIFFRQYRPEKCVLLYSRTKQQLFRL